MFVRFPIFGQCNGDPTSASCDIVVLINGPSFAFFKVSSTEPSP